uniref:Uncharacterized protein n=1 Tax=Anguilla anguilla TaxID=7936 RepID=A0A0E9VHV8_ANGAN
MCFIPSFPSFIFSEQECSTKFWALYISTLHGPLPLLIHVSHASFQAFRGPSPHSGPG